MKRVPREIAGRPDTNVLGLPNRTDSADLPVLGCGASIRPNNPSFTARSGLGVMLIHGASSGGQEFTGANAGFAYDYQLIDVGDGPDGRGESEPVPHFFQNLAEAEYLVTVYQCAPPPSAPCLPRVP